MTDVAFPLVLRCTKTRLFSFRRRGGKDSIRMGRVFQPLLFMLARCTRHELIRHIDFLKAENEILRSRLDKKYVILRPCEKARLVKLGMAIGPKLKDLLSIVSYPTFRKWIYAATNKVPTKKRGRPATPEETRELILKIARETDWGYTRILGELHKLGIYSVSRQTVVNILKANGFDPGPRKGHGTWDEFLKIHGETLWQCDFFSRRILTRLGYLRIHLLIFVNLATRRVWVSPSTYSPTAPWMERQAAAFIRHTEQEGVPAVRMVTRDNDVKYELSFDALLTKAGARVRKLAIRAPNTNAYVERFIQTLQVECLDHFILFGKKHLDHIAKEYVEHYHTERPHQGLGNEKIKSATLLIDKLNAGVVRRRDRLGGLLKHYFREAA